MLTLRLQTMSLFLLDFAGIASIHAAMIEEPEKPCHLSTTQLGTIAETLVSAQLMLVSGGRLSTFVPQADDDGIDLLVLDKLTRQTLAIQIKARYAAIDKPGPIQFDTRVRTFRDVPGTWVLAVAVDPDSATLWRLWLIPSSELRSPR